MVKLSLPIPRHMLSALVKTSSQTQQKHFALSLTSSHVCRYPTFTRMEPPDTQVTTSVLALLKYHKWFKFTIVSQKNEQWRTIAEDLRMQAEMRPEFTVSNTKNTLSLILFI